MKSKICLIFLIISLLISCKSNKYERLIENVNDYKMIQKMDDAKNALELLDKAIKMEPNRWDAYSKKIQIYNFWEHIPYDFKENQEGIKSVFEQWIANGNQLNRIQQCCYANTLYTLGDSEESEKYYTSVFNWYRENEFNFESNQSEYFVYILSGAMLGIINKSNLSDWTSAYYEGDFNNSLYNIVEKMENPDTKREIAKCYCIC